MEFIDGKDYTLALWGGKAAGSLKGTTKRGDVKIFTGGEAYCMSEGERLHNLRCHAVYLVAVMHELGASKSIDLVRDLSVALS